MLTTTVSLRHPRKFSFDSVRRVVAVAASGAADRFVSTFQRGCIRDRCQFCRRCIAELERLCKRRADPHSKALPDELVQFDADA